MTGQWELPARCLACGGESFAWFFQSATWAVARCRHCGLGQAVDTPTPEVLRGGVPLPWRGTAEHLAHRHMYADRVERIEALAPPPGRWLDVGCGGGGLIAAAARRGYDVEGIEPGPAADWARTEHAIPIYRGYLSTAMECLRQTTYDIVSYFHVLEHVWDPEEELRLARGLLRRDGAVLIEVPRFDAAAWALLRHRHRHFLPHHRWYFTRESFVRLLERARFRVQTYENVPYHISAEWLLYRLGVPSAVRTPLTRLTRSLPVRVDQGDVALAVARLA